MAIREIRMCDLYGWPAPPVPGGIGPPPPAFPAFPAMPAVPTPAPIARTQCQNTATIVCCLCSRDACARHATRSIAITGSVNPTNGCVASAAVPICDDCGQNLGGAEFDAGGLQQAVESALRDFVEAAKVAAAQQALRRTS